MKILFKLAVTEGLFLAQNAPKIVCRPGSARTRWGSLQRSPIPPSWIKRGPTSKEGRAGEGGAVGDGRERVRRGGDGNGRG